MLLLIDYSSMLYRAYHSVPSSVPMNGVHGFLSMLARTLEERKPDRLAMGTDADWRPAFRVDLLPMYKAQRVSDVPDPVTPQEIFGRQVLNALGFAVIGAEGYEAEDVIATLAERAKEPVEILSGDRDLFELVRDPDVKVLYPSKGILHEVDYAWITERYDIPGDRYGDFALLRGDPSDGLPGVAGIGEKTAAKLIREHGSLAALLQAQNLPATIRRKLEAAASYLDAVQRVVFPVRDLNLPQTSLELPSGEREPEILRAAERDHRLGGSLERVQKALLSLRK